jgi:hypothetical protein
VSALVFGSPEAEAVLRRAKSGIDDPIDPAVEVTHAETARSIVDLILDTYADHSESIYVRGDGAIVIDGRWEKELLKGIKRILREAAQP